MMEKGNLSRTNSSSTFFDHAIVRCDGFLMKKGLIRRNWKSRYFVLNNGYMSYYSNQTSKKPLGRFIVRGCLSGPTKALAQKYANSFQIITPKRIFFLYGETLEDFNKWKEALVRNGATWEEGVAKRATIYDDGSVNYDWEAVESKVLQEAFTKYREEKQKSDPPAQKRESKPSDSFLVVRSEVPPLDHIEYISEKIEEDKGELVVKTNGKALIQKGGVIHFKLDHQNSWKIVREEWKGRPFLIAKCVESLQQYVVECNYTKVKKLLEDIPGLKADDYPQTSFETPLMTALNNADIKMVRLLLSKGANPNSVSSYGEYPIFIALRLQHEELIKLLIKSGVDFNVKNHEGRTPLEWVDDQLKCGLSEEKVGQMKRWITY